MTEVTKNRPRAAGLRSGRTTVRRRAERAIYDRGTVNQILDEALYCHVGFVRNCQPYVIPTIHARVDHRLYLHGAVASRMLRVARGGVPLCVTATLLDGLVLARSAFHHSLNYRSVVVLGSAVEVTDQGEKLTALRAIVEHFVKNRWRDVRHPSAQEIAATTVLRIAIEEASVKHRAGPPVEDSEDYALGCWAGEIPLRLTALTPEPDPRLLNGIELPEYLARYRRPARATRKP